jgi:hypothetical protein
MTLGTLAAAVAVDSRAIDSFGMQSPFVSCLSPAEFRASYACCSIVVRPGNREGHGEIDNQQCSLFYEHAALTAQHFTPPERDHVSTRLSEELPAGPHDANVEQVGPKLRGDVAAPELSSRELRFANFTPSECDHASRMIAHRDTVRLWEELPTGPHRVHTGRMGSIVRGDVAALELRSRELRFENLRLGCHVEFNVDGNAPWHHAYLQRCFVKEPADVETSRLGCHVDFYVDGNAPWRLANLQRCFVKEHADVENFTPSEWDHALRMINHTDSRLCEELPTGPHEAIAVHVGSICRRDVATFGLASNRPEIKTLRFVCTHTPAELDCCSSGPGGSLDTNRSRHRSELETSRRMCAHTPTELDGCSSGSGSPWTQKGSAAETNTPTELSGCSSGPGGSLDAKRQGDVCVVDV